MVNSPLLVQFSLSTQEVLHCVISKILFLKLFIYFVDNLFYADEICNWSLNIEGHLYI